MSLFSLFKRNQYLILVSILSPGLTWTLCLFKHTSEDLILTAFSTGRTNRAEFQEH